MAQGTRTDYERASNLRRLTEHKVFRERVAPHWLPGNNQFWYRVETGPETHEFVFVDAVRGTREPAFDHARLAAALVAAGLTNATPRNLPLTDLGWLPAEHRLEFAAGGRTWRCDLATYRLEAQPAAPPAPRPAVPRELPRASTRTGAETALTFINRTPAEVELFWLDPDGQRQSYGRLAAGGERHQHTFAGHVWLVVDHLRNELGLFQAQAEAQTVEIRPDGKAPTTVTVPPPPAVLPGLSPDGRWIAGIKDQNVVVTNRQTGGVITLSHEGTATDGYGERFWWSPDSTKLVALRTKQGQERKVYLIESSPKDQLQPRLHWYEYLKPGDRIPQDQPHLFDVGARREIPLNNELFSNPWSIENVRWEPDGKRFTFVYNQRGHQVLRIIAIDAGSGAARTVVNEESSTFIDYAFKQYAHYLDATGEVIWMSERDGWNQLYLYDAHSGRVKNQITAGDWVVRGVDRVEDQPRRLWFRAGGIRPGQDPYYIHYCRINFDGSGLVVLTEGDGTHTADFSPDRRFFVDTWSRVDQPPVIELRRSEDGQKVCDLERADWSRLLATGWRPPERFVAKGRDGATDIYGVLYRPTNFDPNTKYPVVEQIYAGPQDAYVPKAFHPFYPAQELAELGFIVVQIDGMGTSWRSKRFHDVCWQHLADAGFPDRILWLKAAAAQYPQMDLTRVGIYGGSAGGQNAMRALLDHGDFYKVAVADCGCHDNRMDKIWWNELWMGWPVGPQYAENSNVTQADRLQGKLLLVVGELDRNVDPASTMQVVNALVKADKDFDLLVVPGAGHGAAETPYGKRRRADYFVRNLLGVEPRSTP